MGIVVKPVEVIAYFDINGKPRPERFRLVNDEGDLQTVKDIRIICSNADGTADNLIDRFQCESYMDGVAKRFELRFEKGTSRWTIKYEA